jgi:putative ABC transport system ATP-binding protein
MYKLSGVTKNYQKGRSTVAALRGVDLVIEDGEWLAVQGPTGHGKSTLLQILGGLDRPSSGIVEFDGRDLAQLRETEVTKVRAQSIGFVFQTFNLIPTLSALENVEAALVPLRVGSAARQQRATMALEVVGLADRLRHVPGELSGGQQQRVAIARALVKEPKVLLADEPTGNLDEDTRDDIIGLLETMWRERGLTMVLVTHDSSIARRAQRIGVMKNGRLGFKQPRPGQSRPGQSRPGQAARVQAARTGGSVSTSTGAAPSPAVGLIPAEVQPTDVQPTDVQPTDVQPTGAQAGPPWAADPAYLEPPRLQPPDLAPLKDADLDPDLDDADLDDADLDDADLDSELEDDADLDSELPDFDDPDSEPADTITFD